MKYWWKPYISHGRKQFRIGIYRLRKDRVEPEYKFIALEWQL